MPNLEIKVPPVLVAFIFALLMWLLTLVVPGIFIAASVVWPSVIILVVIAAFFSIAGVVSFKKASTTVNPTTPDASSSLVTSGIYTRTRNPMYLGFLFFLFAWGVYLSNLYSIIFSAGFVLYMSRFQILPEETALLSRFGKPYSVYMSRVRRWL
jgi:protein-S-isoprenylcysteine O-methyltransferase Ste14